MSWNGDGPPLDPPFASPSCGDHNDPTWSLPALAFVIQQLSTLLFHTTPYLPSPATTLIRAHLVTALSNVAFTSLHITTPSSPPSLPSHPTHTPPPTAVVNEPGLPITFTSATELPCSSPPLAQAPSVSTSPCQAPVHPSHTIRELTPISPLPVSAPLPTLTSTRSRPSPRLVTTHHRRARHPRSHSCPSSPAPSPPQHTSPNPFAALAPADDDSGVAQCQGAEATCAPSPPSSPSPSSSASPQAPSLTISSSPSSTSVITSVPVSIHALETGGARQCGLPPSVQNRIHNAVGLPPVAPALPLDPIKPVIVIATCPPKPTSDASPTSVITPVPISIPAPEAEVVPDSVDCLPAYTTPINNAVGLPIAAPALPLDSIKPVIVTATSEPQPTPHASITAQPTPIAVPAEALTPTPIRTPTASPAPSPITAVLATPRVTRSKTCPGRLFTERVSTLPSIEQIDYFQSRFWITSKMCPCCMFPATSSDLQMKKFPFPELDHLCLLCLFGAFSSLGPKMIKRLNQALPNVESDLRNHYVPFYSPEEQAAIAATITDEQADKNLDLDECRARQMLDRMEAENEGDSGEEEEEKEEDRMEVKEERKEKEKEQRKRKKGKKGEKGKKKE